MIKKNPKRIAERMLIFGAAIRSDPEKKQTKIILSKIQLNNIQGRQEKNDTG